MAKLTSSQAIILSKISRLIIFAADSETQNALQFAERSFLEALGVPAIQAEQMLKQPTCNCKTLNK